MKSFEEALAEWIEVSAAQKRLAAKELMLRRQIFDAAFPDPVKGVNSLELADGRIVKGTYRINTTVDEAAVGAVKEQLRALGQNDVTADDVFKVKHSVSATALNKLSAEGKLIASRAIVSKPGTPTLEVV